MDEIEMDENQRIAERMALVGKIFRLAGGQIVKLAEPEIMRVKDEYGKEHQMILSYYVEDGNGVRVSDNWQTEALAWEHADIPDYLDDANAAFSLWDKAGIRAVSLIITPSCDGEYWCEYRDAERHYLPGSGSYYLLPEAVSRAWLVWKEAAQAE